MHIVKMEKNYYESIKGSKAAPIRGNENDQAAKQNFNNGTE